jgi:hypothetical protein
MFRLTMGYEAHLNISQKVFVDRFLYTTVVKWTHKNKNVFVYVNCFYVTVGLRNEILYDSMTKTCLGILYPPNVQQKCPKGKLITEEKLTILKPVKNSKMKNNAQLLII